MIDVLIVEPDKVARRESIGTELKDLQSVVDGLIECYYPFNDKALIICNDEGKINGLPLSRGVFDESGELIEIIAGAFIVCGDDGENFISLTEEQFKTYDEMFHYPQTFIRIGDHIAVIDMK